MYAIIHDGGHQYRVEPGQVLQVQKKEAEVGGSFTFEKVTALGGDELLVGSPYLSGASVEATVLRQVKGKKITVRHFRRRQNSRRKAGHRQKYTEVRVDSINA